MRLNKLKKGEKAQIVKITNEDRLGKRLLELGFIPNEIVEVLNKAPSGDPIQVNVRGSRLILRQSEAECINITKSIVFPSIQNIKCVPLKISRKKTSSKIKKFALAGNQNCGKTTLFNQLTGANQHVGNFPGVTVECRSGAFKFHDNAEVTDLPGIYSLHPFSDDEAVAADFLNNNSPDCIINIVSGVNLERNLYLTTQLAELGIPMVIAINMIDELRACGGSVDTKQLSEMLGMPIIAISAAKNEGIDELVNAALVQAECGSISKLPYFGSEKNFENEVVRRYQFIDSLLKKTYKRGEVEKSHGNSKTADSIFTGKFTAFPTFIAIMAAVFWLTFGSFGQMLQGIMQYFIERIGFFAKYLLKIFNVNYVLSSLIIDGILGGVGSVMSFLTIIMLLFFLLSILEDSGYMARIAFITDSVMRKFGLSGRSIVPVLIGFGCTVPAVMSSRTISSERERKLAVIMLPFVSCTAKLPIYGLFTSIFFPEYSAFIISVIYIFGIAMGILNVSLLEKFRNEANEGPMLMEMPDYRMPTAKNTLMLMWSKAKDFMKKAFTLIFLASTAIWFMQHFDLHFRMTENPDGSILAIFSGMLSPFFVPLGFGDWRITAALLTGFVSKESVVSTVAVLFAGGGISEALTPLSALSLLVFCLLYTPCIAAIAAVNREFGSKFAVKMIILQCVIAWICAFVIHLAGSFIL